MTHEETPWQRNFRSIPNTPNASAGAATLGAADAMACGNGSDRSMHPAELLGDDWYTVGNWGLEVEADAASRDANGKTLER